MNGHGPKQRSGGSWLWLLLLIPYIGLLWVPFYNHVEPKLFGFPFFYWYQLLWVPISAVLTWIVYQGLDHND
ncbi:MAG: hypothetical protein QOH65_2781 [Methylobacteriaceae bacterium]|jgi:hypothetical protein|nr:hypothetical protein [Methylobacteriaceae bacterium]